VSDLVIRSGGAIEVDTRSLRAVAVELEGIAGEAGDIAADVRGALVELWTVGREALPVQWLTGALVDAVARAGDDADALARRVRLAADQYEAVDLLVQRGFAEARGDAAGVRRLDGLLAALAPEVRRAAERSIDDIGDVDELARQAMWGAMALGFPAFGLAPSLVRALAGTVPMIGGGRIHAGDRLSGPAVAVDVRRLSTAPSAPPASLADVAARIPGGGDSRIRVERYTMPSGRVEFAVYIAGMQTLGGGDAFDAASNLELYGGAHSASYDATLDALQQAGARPGDVIHAFGHSQGGMIAERIAVDGPYEVRTVGTFGSPVQADVPDATLAVSVRHTDDPVVALQAGGHATGVGAASSFVVERVADPAPGVRDVLLPAHQMTAYSETAALVDASADPRVDALRSVFAGLERAENVEAAEYSAERVSRASADGG
jgi:pimeloyl-ACP methyl ester carboxylesterase